MLPVLLDFGSVKIYATGAMWGIATIIAGIAVSRAAYRKGYHPLWIWDLVAFGFIGGLIAARIGFFITKPGALGGDIFEIFKIWKGGLSLHWGVLGGIIVGYFQTRKLKINFLEYADVWGPGLALGLAISRFGCILGGHCFGIPCDDCWYAITYSTEPMSGGMPTSYPMDGIPRHPAQLYHVIANLAVYLLLLRMQLKPVLPGRVFAGFIIFYSVGRFIVEFWRDDMVMAFWGLTVAQVASVLLVAIGIAMWWWSGRVAKRKTEKIPEKTG
jgi:phosphatidylglycerol:prolipoprotein diacylglycerol transferase